MTDNIPSKPIPEGEELHGCVVMECSVGRFDQLNNEFQGKLEAQDRLIKCQFEVLKAFSDLYLELTDRTKEREFLYKSILKAEREAARLRLPTWFFRTEQGASIETMLARRARFLIEEHKTHVDDTWDLLREFADEHAEQPISDEVLIGIVEGAQKHASA